LIQFPTSAEPAAALTVGAEDENCGTFVER
jgi:hypothetical protein